MHESCPSSLSSHSGSESDLSSGRSSIGSLFRDYGEAYISSYRPCKREINLIRSVRLCRTPALGGHRLTCMECGHEWYRYFSCGHSHCPICQGGKRQSCHDRLESKLLQLPYCHITFTVPHELNGICRVHPRELYNILFRSAWQSIAELSRGSDRIGGLPGMTAVLHSWGSDLKQHVHVHCLVTYGGLDEKSSQWKWPICKHKLFRHRALRNRYRKIFLGRLKCWMKGEHSSCIYHQSYEVLTADLIAKTWVVNQQPPTADAKVINAYLSRYICRIGISDSRLQYDAKTQSVRLEYKDYRKQKPNEAAPVAYRDLSPLLAMRSILQHLLPANFHRSRHYGLHAYPTYKRVEQSLPGQVRRHPATIRMLFMLLKRLLLKPLTKVCDHCGSV
ncbi:MAG: transposase, partial [Bacteroidota bacterium]